MRPLATRSRVTFLLGWLFVLFLRWAPASAQAVPAGEGAVADSTELRVLREFYQATGGPGWAQRAGWDSLAAWTRLPAPGRLYGVRAEGGDVVDLTLFNNGLRGPLPPGLAALRALEALRLDQNHLEGPLPAVLGGLPRLGTLEVSSNRLTGAVPAALGRLRGLRYLRLNNNAFTQLPDSLGQLTNLILLLVGQNPLPPGPLPAWLANLRQLQYLYADEARLTGPLPGWVGRLPALHHLVLAGNALGGPLPDALGRCLQLERLDLSHNRFSGPLPDSLARLTQLFALLADHNALTGPLPAGWGQLRGLAYLHLSHNALTGTIPAEYRALTRLDRLDLSQNRLSGPVPDSLRAAYLLLDHNALTALPDSYGTQDWNRQLRLDANALTQLPSFLAHPQLASLLVTGYDNVLDFASLEANQLPGWRGAAQPGWALYAHGQRPPGPADTTQAVAGAPARLDGAIGGTHNQYHWQREVGGQWADVPGDTLAARTWAAVGPADAGAYRTHVTNTWVPFVDLYSRTHYLDVTPYPPLALNLPVDAHQGVPLATPPAAPDQQATAPVDVNFVRTWSPREALMRETQVPLAPVDSVAVSTTFLDGLGRPVQTVLRQASPARRDLVQPQAYDALGREPRQYLPYPALPAGSVTAEGYRYRALTDQQEFYQPGPAGPLNLADPTRGVARTGAAFAETLFEASPLNRAVAQGAAGEAWQLTAGHVVERAERPNAAADSVLRFAPGYDPAVVDPGYQGFYAPGELWGTDVADAHGPNEVGARGYRTVEWKDKEGQLVLRQVEAGRAKVAGGERSRWLRTAYAYDDFGRLRYVVQPEGTKRLLPLGDAPAVLPATVAPFLFHYRFDGRGRQIAKQVPGTDGETVVVFDQLDRPVLSQDAAQRARREWSWTKYDVLGRVVLNGLVTRADTAGQVTLQARAAADTATAHQYEQRTAAATFPQHYTTDQAFPQLGHQGFGAGLVLNVTYYDDYNFDHDAAGTADAHYDATTDGSFAAGAAPVADAQRTTGLTTRTLTRVLDKPDPDPGVDWLTTTTFYDERARPVQVQTGNARGGVDLLTTQLDFTGKVVQSVAVHRGPNHAPVHVAEFFTYDHTGRLLSTRQQLPGEAQPTQIAQVAYNEIGQATQKTMGTGRLTQQVDYAYNVRGWLTNLNNPYAPKPADLFSLSLHYEQGFTAGYEQYNGNLTGQTWRGRDGVQRAYGYAYDPLNRLLQGDFVARAGGAPSTTGAWTAELDHYRMAFVSYDDNGNLLTLRRRGLLRNATHATAKQFGPVDNLTYAYAGNRLQAVDDAVSSNQLPRPLNYNGAPASLAGDFQEGGTHLGQEYLYDANGNLTQDRNKGITNIAYNHLNLPRRIHFGIGADSVVFRYTASGQKVAKLVYQTGKPVQRTDYLGPYQYEQDSLRFFPHAEGRVLRFANTTSGAVRYEREFTFKDHLGNLRLAYRAGQRRVYEATLEQDDATHGRESQQFDSLSVSPPVAVPTGLASRGSYAARLNAGGSAPQPLGPLTQFAVQQGDTVRAQAFGLYPQATSDNSFAFSLASFVASLLQPAPAGTPAGADGARRGGLPLLHVGLNAAALPLLAQPPRGVPNGYLRLLVFTEDSVLIPQQTRTIPLGSAALNNYELLDTQPLVLQQNGYVSVYVGNESAADVYFDDVRIEHRQGLQVQENQYDPFGGDLAGVSGAAPGLRLKNFYQFNGKENQLDLGLNWSHQDWRFYDYQIGRWHVVDPLVEAGQESWTPYSFGFNNAVRYADADGQYPGEGLVSQAIDFANGAANAIASNASGVGPVSGVRRWEVSNPYSMVRAGQTAGDLVSLVQGAGEFLLGGTAATGGTVGGIVTSPTGAGAVAGAAVAVAGVALAGHGLGTANNAMRNLLNSDNGRVYANHKNRIPDTGSPNSVNKNTPGTTHKKYGPDGVVQKEFNKGHRAPGTPKNELTDHIHDHKPRPNRHPDDPQPTERQAGRAPKRNELLKDFGIK